ncbi:MAG: tetratricopeptide repeat protein [Erysipelotrichaceae bacterium]
MLKITKSKLLFILLLSLSLFSCKGDSNYEKGLQAFENHNYEEAVTYLENSLTEDNDINKEEINLILSKAYINLGKYIEAIEILDGTDSNKTNEFIDELLKGYDLINEDGINHKTVKISLYKEPYPNVGINLRGNLYNIENTFPVFCEQYIYDHYRDVMILEIDKINYNHRFFTCSINDTELNDGINGFSENIKVAIDYKNGEPDAFTVTEDNSNVEWCTKVYTRVYDNEFNIQKYTTETYYPIDVEGKDILEAEFSYHDNGALAKYDYRIKRFLTDQEICNIMDSYIHKEEIHFDINDIKKRQDYVKNESGIFTYTEDERFLKEEYYESDILKRNVTAVYDENNRIISYTATNYKGYKSTYAYPFEWSYEYNDDGYLIKEEIIRRDIFYPEGYYATYEYSEDYTVVTVTEHCSSSERDGNIYTLYLHPDGYYYYEEYIPNE